MDDAIAWELRQDRLQGVGGFVVVAFFFEDASVEEIGAREIGFQRESFKEDGFCAFGVAFLDADAADVGPAVEIFGSDFGDFCEGLLGAAEIALEEEADAVVVPAGPVVFGERNLRRGRCGGVGEDADGFGVFSDDDDGRSGMDLDLAETSERSPLNVNWRSSWSFDTLADFCGSGVPPKEK